MSDLRLTFPNLLPSRVPPGEEYATVEQILRVSDLPQATLHIPQWRLWIRVRALSLAERDRVLRESGIVAQYCMAWQIGCLAPHFTADQAAALADKNFHAIEQGAQFILVLSAIDQETIDRVVSAQTAAEPASAPADPAAPSDGGGAAIPDAPR